MDVFVVTGNGLSINLVSLTVIGIKSELKRAVWIIEISKINASFLEANLL